MSSWESDLTFPRGPFPPRRTDGGGVAFTAAPDDFAYASVATLPPLPAPEPEPAVAEAEVAPEPAEAVSTEGPEKTKKRGLFGRKKRTGEAERGPQIESIPADEPAPAIVTSQTAPVVLDESALEIGGEPTAESTAESTAGPTAGPAKGRKRRLGRKKSAQEESVQSMDETVAPTVESEEAAVQVAEESEAPATVVAEADELIAAQVESPAEPVTASPETTRDTTPEVVNLVESHSTPDSSLVDAWIRVPAGVQKGTEASAPAAWRDTGPSSPGAGSLPPMNGVSWQTPDSYDFDNGSTEEEPSSDLLTGEPDGQQGPAPAEGSEQEAPSRRSRRSQKKAAKKQARQDKADSKRATKGKKGKKGKDVSEPEDTSAEKTPAEPEVFVPSFGFVSHPEYDLKWASMAHLATIPLLWFGLGFLAPFVVLAARGEQSQFVRNHAQASLNFQLSLLIYMLLTGFLGVFSPLLFVVPLLVGIVAAVAAWFSGQRAKNNQEAKYYLALPIF